MLRFIIAINFISLSQLATAQIYEWARVGGGTGSFDQGNINKDSTGWPRARSEFASCNDGNGNMWLFGGRNYSQYYSDLWHWNGQNWKLIDGSVDVDSRPIHQKVDSSHPRPTPRQSATIWYGGENKIYLFGGDGGDSSGKTKMHSDQLWLWDGKKWSLISGTSRGISSRNFGQLNKASKSNTPGSTAGVSAWSDSLGNQWIFGGHTSEPSNHWNQVWRWDGTFWTWMSGDSIPESDGSFGVLNKASKTNSPPARDLHCSIYQSEGKMYVFGGHYFGVRNKLNDFWFWNGNNWTWLDGDSSETDNYNEFIDSGKIGWIEDAAGTIDTRNRPLMFGGFGKYWFPKDNQFIAYINHLWLWENGKWNRIKGDFFPTNQSVYDGQKHHWSFAPSSRRNSVLWTDKTGVIWMYGGSGINGSLNDLWRLVAVPSYSEIRVLGKDSIIPNGQTKTDTSNYTYFGPRSVTDLPKKHRFYLGNNGNDTLKLLGEPIVQITGLNPKDFAVEFPKSVKYVLSGDTIPFFISFKPLAEGIRQAQVSIESNDAKQNPFTFIIEGRGEAAEISVINILSCSEVLLQIDKRKSEHYTILIDEKKPLATPIDGENYNY